LFQANSSGGLQLAWFKIGQVERENCIASGVCDLSDPRIGNFSRFLLKNAEHTWGRDVKTFLHDTGNWTNAELQAAIASGAPNFAVMLQSWQEQRDFGIYYALEALGSHPLAETLQTAWNSMYPSPLLPNPALLGYAPFDISSSASAGRFVLRFDSATGAIGYLQDNTTGQVWADASESALLGVIHYQTYNETDFDNYVNAYCDIVPVPDWFGVSTLLLFIFRSLLSAFLALFYGCRKISESLDCKRRRTPSTKKLTRRWSRSGRAAHLAH
jgi:hypothetical protein